MRCRDKTFFCEENYRVDSKLTDLGEACAKHHVLFLHHNQGKPFLMEVALQMLDTHNMSELQCDSDSNPRI